MEVVHDADLPSLDQLNDYDQPALKSLYRQLYGRQIAYRRSRATTLLPIISYLLQAHEQSLDIDQYHQSVIDRLSRRNKRHLDIAEGTRLVREWHGLNHIVEVESDGFRYEGRKYSSLSEIAREITGTRWSGPRFFGLKDRPKP